MWRSIRASLGVMLLGLTGCASTPSLPSSGDQYSDLYDERLQVLFATQFPVRSAQDAMMKADQALRNGSTDLALFNYVRALQLDGKNYEAFYKIGSIHDSREDRERAELAYRWTLKLADNHAGALEGVGLILMERRQRDSAKKALAKAVKADPRRWRAHNALGVIADLRKDYRKAESYYRAALQFAPHSPLVLNNLGYSKYLSGAWTEAQRMFELALNYNPGYQRAWMNLGLLHTRRGTYTQALQAFRRVMDKPSAYNNLGYVAMMDGDYQRAKTFLRKAIQLSPTYYVTANENLEQINTLDQSQQAFSRATPTEDPSENLLEGKPSLLELEPLIIEATNKEEEDTSEVKDDATPDPERSVLPAVNPSESPAPAAVAQPNDEVAPVAPSFDDYDPVQEKSASLPVTSQFDEKSQQPRKTVKRPSQARPSRVPSPSRTTTRMRTQRAHRPTEKAAKKKEDVASEVKDEATPDRGRPALSAINRSESLAQAAADQPNDGVARATLSSDGATPVPEKGPADSTASPQTWPQTNETQCAMFLGAGLVNPTSMLALEGLARGCLDL